MVNFKIGNESWKVYWSTWQETGTKSQTEIEPMTSWTLGGHSINWSTRTHGEWGHLTEFISDRCPCIALGSALLKIVSSNLVNKDMVNFTFSNKNMKGVLINMTRAWDKENLLGDSAPVRFSLSHARVMLSNSPLTRIEYLPFLRFRERKTRKSTPPSLQ